MSQLVPCPSKSSWNARRTQDSLKQGRKHLIVISCAEDEKEHIHFKERKIPVFSVEILWDAFLRHELPNVKDQGRRLA